MNEKLLTRYLKVKALADRGEAGEKAAAQQILRSLEEKHPGIQQAAAAHKRSQETPQSRQPARSADGGTAGNWEQIFRYAAGFYSTVKDVVEDVTDAYYGKELAEDEVEFSGYTRGEVLFIRMKFSFDLVHELRGLNAVQKESFRQSMHAQFEAYLDSVLEE